MIVIINIIMYKYMLYKLKENLPTIEILLGCAVFLYFIIYSSISFAILWAIFIIYVWLFTSLLFGQYHFQKFVYLTCSFGIVLSISLFFIHGVEELAYPEGALMFHLEGVVKSLILFFVSSTPLILMYKKNSFSKETSNTKKHRVPKYNQEQWEEASIEDLESGDFETI